MCKSKCRKKLKSKKAFTLSETLVAMLIMLMVSSVLVTGIPAAKNAYEKVFVKSNAEMLMSTTIYELRNQMSGARDITVTKDGNGKDAVGYLNPEYNSYSKLFLGDEGIMFQRYAYMNDEGGDLPSVTPPEEPTTEPLVTRAASDGLFVKYDSVDKEKGRITYKGLGIYKNVDDEKSILKKRDFSVNTF